MASKFSRRIHTVTEDLSTNGSCTVSMYDEPIEPLYYMALSSALSRTFKTDGGDIKGGKECFVYLKDDELNINITVSFRLNDSAGKVNTLKELVAELVNQLNIYGVSPINDFSVLVTRRDGVSKADTERRYGWNHAFIFLNAFAYKVSGRSLIDSIKLDLVPDDDVMRNIINTEKSGELYEDIRQPIGDEEVPVRKPKNQPEVKIFRTEISEANDPYWQELDRKWKVK